MASSPYYVSLAAFLKFIHLKLFLNFAVISQKCHVVLLITLVDIHFLVPNFIFVIKFVFTIVEFLNVYMHTTI